MRKGSKKNYLVIFVALSLLFRLVLLWFAANHSERAFNNPDAYMYDRIAKNLLEYGEFSGGAAKGANFLRLSFEHTASQFDTQLIPDSFRTPLYSAFLAGIYAIFGHNIPVVLFAQVLFSLLTCLLVYSIVKNIFNQTVGLIAFVLMSVNLELLAYPNYVLTETLFMCLLTSAIWFFVKFLKTDELHYLFFSAVFVGISTLCKPAGQYFSLILILVIFAKFGWNIKKSLQYSALVFIVFLLVVSPWLIRNYRVFGAAKVSSMQGYDLFLHRVAFQEGEKNGGSYEAYEEARTALVGELQQIIDAGQLNSMQASAVAEKLGKQRLLEDPVSYIRAHVKGMIRIFVGHSLKTVYAVITDKPYESGSALSLFLETGDFKQALSAIFDPTKPIALLVLLIVAARGLLYLALLYGCCRALFTRPLYLCLFVLILGYFVSVIGPYGVEPRFRTQIIPALTVLMSYGVFESLKLFGCFKKQRISSRVQ